MTTQIKLAPDVAERLDRQAADTGRAAEDLVNTILRRELDAPAEQPTADTDRQNRAAGTLADLFAGRIGRVQGSGEPFARESSARYADLLEEEYRHREPEL